jgi:hypothetical protein
MFTRIATGIGAAAVAIVVTACGHTTAEPQPPAKVTRIPGSAVQQVQLSGPASRRLGIATATVRVASVAVEGRTRPHKIIPYSAVVYDTNGRSWAYISTAPRTYRRQPITILDIRGNSAVLARGPAAGTAVVTVGAPELLGTEYNISGEM